MNTADVIAHIAWHEGQMVGVLEAHDLVGSELWDLPLDQRNAAIYEVYKDHPLAEVRQEALQTYEIMMKLLASFPAGDLEDTASFPNMPPEWQPWELIANNTYEHYEDHGKGVLHA